MLRGDGALGLGCTSISRVSLEFPASDPKGANPWLHAVYGLFGDKPPTLKERIIMKCSARDS